MSQLAALQSSIIKGIFDRKQLPSASLCVKDQGELTAEQRLGIYRGSVHGILTQALADTFPVCKALVGETFFDRMTDVFIDQAPPSTPFFSEYGRGFSAFLDEFHAVQSIPYLKDVAALEWSRNQAWHGINQAVSDFSLLGQLPAETQLSCCFEMPDSAQLLSFAHNAEQIWLAHQVENTIDLSAVEIDVKTQMIVWRYERQVMMSSLTESQYTFLQAVQENKNLGELAALAGESLSVLLAETIQQGWIIAFRAAD